MGTKLDEIKKRYIELEQMLSDHAVVADTNQCSKYARELSEITPVVKKANELDDVKRQISELTHILSDKSHSKDFLELAVAEIKDLEQRSTLIELQIEDLMRPPDPDLNRNCMVEVRAGTGGQEAGLFAADL